MAEGLLQPWAAVRVQRGCCAARSVGDLPPCDPDSPSRRVALWAPRRRRCCSSLCACWGNAQKSMSGIGLHDSCINLYNHMKTRSSFKFVTYKIDDAGLEVREHAFGWSGRGHLFGGLLCLCCRARGAVRAAYTRGTQLILGPGCASRHCHRTAWPHPAHPSIASQSGAGKLSSQALRRGRMATLANADASLPASRTLLLTHSVARGAWCVQVVVDQLGAPDATYEQFLATFPGQQCRYGGEQPRSPGARAAGARSRLPAAAAVCRRCNGGARTRGGGPAVGCCAAGAPRSANAARRLCRAMLTLATAPSPRLRLVHACALARAAHGPRPQCTTTPTATRTRARSTKSSSSSTGAPLCGTSHACTRDFAAGASRALLPQRCRSTRRAMPARRSLPQGSAAVPALPPSRALGSAPGPPRRTLGPAPPTPAGPRPKATRMRMT